MSYRIESALVPNSESKRFREGGRVHYQVRGFLESASPDELDKVDSVEYELHPTFRERHRTGRDHSRKFKIRIGSWNYFVVHGKVLLK